MSARRPIDPAARLPAADDADHAGAADAGHHLVAAEFAQLLGHDAGRAVHVVVELGMRWRSRRQAAISSAASAMRLMTGMVHLLA